MAVGFRVPRQDLYSNANTATTPAPPATPRPQHLPYGDNVIAMLRDVMQRPGCSAASLAQVAGVARDVLQSDHHRFDDATKEDMLNDLTAVVLTHAALPKALHRRIEKYVTDYLVALVPRPEERLQFGNVTYVQRCGHIVRDTDAAGEVFWLEHGTTLSSIAIKRDHDAGSDARLQEFNANLAAITVDDRLLALRAARSNSRDKLEERLLAALCAALEAGGGAPDARVTGLHFRPNVGKPGGRWEFRPAIVSALDYAVEKRIVEWLKSAFTRREDEARMIRELERACDALFGGTEPAFGEASRYITRRVRVTVDGRVTVMSVDIYQPRIVHSTLSRQLMNPLTPLNIKFTRAKNRHVARQLFVDLARVWHGQVPRRVDASVVQAMRAARSKQAMVDFLCQVDGKKLTRKQRLALEWLHVVLVGEDSAGASMLGYRGPGKEDILLKYLCDEANIAFLPMCKSGLDRTLLLVALAGATEQYERATGDVFDPRTDDETAKQSFRRFFTLFADTFGASMLASVRGTGHGVKWTYWQYCDWYDPTLSQVPGTLLAPTYTYLTAKLIS